MKGKKKKQQPIEEKKVESVDTASSPILNVNENIKEASQLAYENHGKIEQTEAQVIAAAEKEVKEHKSYRSRYIYTVFFLINIVSFILILWFNSANITPFKELFNGSTWFLVTAFACVIFMTLAEALRIVILVLKSTKKFKPMISYNSSAISKFYDLITPLASGGQSHQIQYLVRNNIKGSAATSVPMTKYIYAQFCYFIFIIIMLFAKQFNLVEGVGGRVVSAFAYIGLGFQFVIFGAVILLSVSKRIGPAITIGILKIANKLRIIKDYREVYIKVLHFVNDYQTSMRKILTDPITFFVMIISSFGVILIRFAIPFFLYCAFYGYNSTMFVPILNRIVMCELAMGIWLLPGNVIIADLAYLAIFKDIFHGTLFWALLFWRLTTYYFFILQGAVVIFITNTTRKIREEREREKKLAQFYVKKPPAVNIPQKNRAASDNEQE